ncbi:MAG: hypothetical protein ACTSQE_09405 [Candidatus Heimdallarchaeaceae archaeon]
MSQNEIRLNEELLDLLEKRFASKEIDEETYLDLKARYTKKLEEAKQRFNEQKESAQIISSGIFSHSGNEYFVAGSAKVSGQKLTRSIKVAGSAKFDTDIECLGFKVAGSAHSSGNILAHKIVKVAGSFVCEGFLHTEEDVRISGSAKIGKDTVINGELSVAGSLIAGDKVQANNGINIKGSADVKGNLLSQSLIKLSGMVNIQGSIIGEHVIIEDKRGFLVKRARLKPLSRVQEHILAKDEVFIESTEVEGDVKGRVVTIADNSEVLGTVFFVDKLEVSPTARLANEPVQISPDNLTL